MKYGNLTVLYALWLVPAVVAFFWFAWRRRRRALELFAAPHLLPVMAPTMNPRFNLVRALLVTTTIILMVVALAMPRWGYRWREVRRRGIDIFVALDVSKSMLAQDVRPNRLEQAKFAVRDLLQMADGNRVGLIAFAGSAFISCPLTLDHSAVQLMLTGASPKTVPLGGTDIAGAIKEAVRGFSHAADRNRALIILTDGEATGGDAVAAAKAAADLGIKIFTIGIGSTSGEFIPMPAEGGTHTFLRNREGRVVQTKLDEGTLQQIALTANGCYVHATAGNFGLDTIYKNGIEPMAPKDFQTKLEQQFEEQYQWPLGLAFVLLIAEALLRERCREIRSVAPATAKSSAKAMLLFGFLFLVSGLTAAETGEAPQKLFNEGNAVYRKHQFDAAAKDYQETLLTQDKELQARAFYNLGNASYHQADAAKETDPKRAEKLLNQAVTCYANAIALNPKHANAAFNKKLVELRLQTFEEQQKKQQQDQKQQQEQEKQPQQPPPRQKPGDQPNPGKNPGQAGQHNALHAMNDQEARMLLDSVRDEERPWDGGMSQRNAGEREPEKDW